MAGEQKALSLLKRYENSINPDRYLININPKPSSLYCIVKKTALSIQKSEPGIMAAPKVIEPPGLLDGMTAEQCFDSMLVNSATTLRVVETA